MGGLSIRGCRCRRRGSSGGWRSADTGGVEEALDAPEAHVVGCGEGGGDGALAVGGDQLGDLALGEALAQAPRTPRGGLGARAGLASATVRQSFSSAAGLAHASADYQRRDLP
jgi:hypothetical protein